MGRPDTAANFQKKNVFKNCVNPVKGKLKVCGLRHRLRIHDSAMESQHCVKIILRSLSFLIGWKLRFRDFNYLNATSCEILAGPLVAICWALVPDRQIVAPPLAEGGEFSGSEEQSKRMLSILVGETKPER